MQMANLKFDKLHRVLSFLDESEGYELCCEPDASAKENDGLLNDDSDGVEMDKELPLSKSHIYLNGGADLDHENEDPSRYNDDKNENDHSNHYDHNDHNNHDDTNHNDNDEHNDHDDGNDDDDNNDHDHDSNIDDYEYDDYDYSASLGSRDTSMIYHVPVLEDAANKKRNRSLAKLDYDRARNILEEHMDNATVSTEILSDLLYELCEAYQTLENANNAYLPYLEPDDEEWENTNVYMENAYRDRCRIQAAISKCVTKRPLSGMAHHDINDFVTNGSLVSIGNRVQMFLIEPPKFSGDIRRFPTFVKDYTKYMESTYGRDAYALRMCLTGKALDVVAGSDDNYEEMWRKLNAYFLNPERLVHSILREIRTLSPLKDNDSLGFIELVDTVERCWQDLRNLQVDKEMDTSTIVCFVERLLPRSQRKKWILAECKERDENEEDAYGESEKLETFVKYLLREKEVYEYLQFYGTSV